MISPINIKYEVVNLSQVVLRSTPLSPPAPGQDQGHVERRGFSGKRALKIGLATLGGGTALALTGG
jgi:hypothetical protein